jgi:hypothetical protein
MLREGKESLEALAECIAHLSAILFVKIFGDSNHALQAMLKKVLAMDPSLGGMHILS